MQVSRVGNIAVEAGGLLRRMSGNSDLGVQEKVAGFDFVTAADLASQKLIREKVLALCPEDIFIGEEDNIPDAEIVKTIRSSDRRIWLADPLDGTMNYLRGLGGYAVSIGVIEKGEVIAGAIYLPESDELYLAEKGCGASVNGRAIHAARHGVLSECVAATHVAVSDMALRRRSNRWNEAVIMASQNLRMFGSCVRTQAKLASGGIDFYYEFGPHPWDCAAAFLIVTEAGGRVSRLDGGPFDFGLGGVFAASDSIYDEALRLLNGVDGHMNDFGIHPA